VERFLNTISSPSHFKNLTAIFRHHWTKKFGGRERNNITELEVQEVFAGIKKEPSTLNHIRHALGSFYKALNGPTGYNPARVLRKVREEYHDARAIPYTVISRLFDHMQDSPTKARLMVMAYTGLPPALIARIEPHDLKLDEQTLYVRPRRKGAGVKGRTLPLSDAGVTALTFFQEQRAFGTFQNKQLQQVFNGAVTRSGVSVPPGTRPYDLRHSFLTEVYRQTGDLRAVAELGMHATLEQTARYATGAVSERATKAVAALPRIPEHGTPPEMGNSEEFKGITIQSSQRGKSRRKD
jgi:integrase